MELWEKLQSENVDFDDLRGSIVVLNHDDKTITICRGGTEQYANYYCWKNDIIDEWTNSYITASINYEKLFGLLEDDLDLEVVSFWDVEDYVNDYVSFMSYEVVGAEGY